MGDKVEVLEMRHGAAPARARARRAQARTSSWPPAAAADVAVYPTKKYWADPARRPEGVVLVGFSSIAEADIRPGIAVKEARSGK